MILHPNNQQAETRVKVNFSTFNDVFKFLRFENFFLNQVFPLMFDIENEFIFKFTLSETQ